MMDKKVEQKIKAMLDNYSLKFVACQYCGTYTYWKGGALGHHQLNGAIKCCEHPAYWYVRIVDDGYVHINGDINNKRNFKLTNPIDIRDYFADKTVPMFDSPWIQALM